MLAGLASPGAATAGRAFVPGHDPRTAMSGQAAPLPRRSADGAAPPTRLKMTPATRHRRDGGQESRTTAETVAPGRAVDHQDDRPARHAAKSAVDPDPSAAPSNRPITPSAMTIRAGSRARRPLPAFPPASPRDRCCSRAGRMPHLGQVDVIGPHLGGPTATPRREARTRPASPPSCRCPKPAQRRSRRAAVPAPPPPRPGGGFPGSGSGPPDMAPSQSSAGAA